MRTGNLHIAFIYKLIAAVVVIIMTACSHDTYESGVGEQDSSAPEYVSLRIALAPSQRGTRAGVPTGGETGDGLRPGLHHENDVENLTLFKFSSAAGVNAAPSTVVRKLTYIPNVNFHPTDNTTSKIIPLEGLTYKHEFGDHFIVAANMGNVGGETMTLETLRNHLVEKAWTESVSGKKADFTLFAMSNASDSHYTAGSGTETNPDIIEVDLERVAARIDLSKEGATADAVTNTLLYDAIDGEDVKVAEVYVSHARVFNGMKSPTYLIKRLAESSTSPYEYLIDEENPASKLVVEPNTWNKGTTDTGILDTWFGASRLGNASALGDSWFRDADRVHTAAPTSGEDGFTTSYSRDNVDNDLYYVIDYVNENTMPQANTKANVTTGIMLKAVYKPVKVYGSLDGEKQPVLDNAYAYGQTFWRYRPIGAQYDETKALYFSNGTVAQDYMDAHPEQIAEITEYTNGKCYYPVYLRHDNTQNTADISMMEFGIVRNNIYRLKVSFTGPGYSNMVIPEEVNPEGIRPYIFVRKWYKINHPEIEI